MTARDECPRCGAPWLPSMREYACAFRHSVDHGVKPSGAPAARDDEVARAIADARVIVISTTRQHWPGVRDLARALLSEHERAERLAAQIREARPLPAAVKSIAEQWERRCKRYIRIGSDWHEKMPGNWPVEEMSLTVAECRECVAALRALPDDAASATTGGG